jgi:ABC-type sugar transport system ATPase subunit
VGSLQLKSIRKTYGTHEVLKGIDLEVKDGEFVIFVGPSGCGKSTLLRSIAGLEDVTSGAVVINGRDETLTPPAKRGIAMVFQSYALYPHLTVKDNMGLGLKQAGTVSARHPACFRWNPIWRGGRPSSPAANASASPSAVPSYANPNSSCLTNRCRTSMRRCASRPVSKSPGCTAV